MDLDLDAGIWVKCYNMCICLSRLYFALYWIQGFIQIDKNGIIRAFWNVNRIRSYVYKTWYKCSGVDEAGIENNDFAHPNPHDIFADT